MFQSIINVGLEDLPINMGKIRLLLVFFFYLLHLERVCLGVFVINTLAGTTYLGIMSFISFLSGYAQKKLSLIRISKRCGIGFGQLLLF